jgi:RNA polymerase sigma-70 factor (ECF subfamily)
MEDISLAEKIRNGDQNAFNDLYKQYYFSVRSYARLLLNENEAEDVVQDVFFNLWKHKDKLDETLSLRGYLFRSVYNTVLNILKRKGLFENYSNLYKQEIEEIGYKHYNPDTNEILQNLYNQELRLELNAAIERLSPRCKEVFSLSFLYDMTAKEISAQLGVSQSTVENHIHNALKTLREKLNFCRKGL